MFGAMRPDAVLTAPPPPVKASTQGGRPPERGRLLRKPEQIARDGRTPWRTTEATLYGRTTTVRLKTLCAQWYRATGTRLLRIVIVATESGSMPYRIFFSFDATLDVRTILEAYAGRWGFFREAKQLLGFADSQARKEAAVLRVAPLVGLLYSTLVIWFAEGVHRLPIAAPPQRPWYRHKVGLCFADVLRAARRTLDGVHVLVPCRDLANLKKHRVISHSACAGRRLFHLFLRGPLLHGPGRPEDSTNSLIARETPTCTYIPSGTLSNNASTAHDQPLRDEQRLPQLPQHGMDLHDRASSVPL
jgi:hypothetical protein